MSKSPLDASAQLPFDLSLEPAAQREDLIESPANATAIAMIDAWPDWPGNTTVLAGPVGSGKTHIAKVWVSKTGGMMCQASELTDRMNAIKDCVDAQGCIVLEDAGADELDETALFHLLNMVRQADTYCLITSRTWPAQWRVTLPDLLSRLRATQVIELLEPDDLLLKQVIIKLFADRQLMIDEKVVDYCVLRMERSLETASALVAAIDSEALAGKSPVSRALAAKVLENLGMQ
ncbi:MAG: hypothetical protein AAGA53_02720 [Pseudomonadota bacterium]